jgi:hypothetical protein
VNRASNSDQIVAASALTAIGEALIEMRRPGQIVARSFAATATRPAVAVPPSSRPTPELLHRHEVVAPQVDDRAFRQGWLVQSRLDGLLAIGRIDREAWECAQEWRRWAVAVMPHRGQRWEARVDDSPVAEADIAMLHRVNAAMRLRQVSDALGELRVRLLECCVLHDFSWRAIAEKLRISDKTAREYVAEALEALADWRAGRTVASPPVLRFRNQPGAL